MTINPLFSAMGYEPDTITFYQDNSETEQKEDPNLHFDDLRCPYGYGQYYVEKKIYVPPTPYIQGRAAIPPTAAQVTYQNNSGWNSWARSIFPLEIGKFYDFSCGSGISGCFIGIGGLSLRGAETNVFQHALTVDQSGIKAHERGIGVSTLKTNQMSITNIRVFLQDDKSIVYCATTGSEVKTYTSNDKCIVPIPYIHGYLYSTDDAILTSSFIPGKVHYGSV
jgi:hypothetical protein